MTEYARRVTLAITLDGYDVAGDFAPYLLDFSYKDNASGKADEIQITLHNRDGLFSGEWMPKKGMPIEAAIICADWEEPGDVFELPCGKFSIDEIEFSGPPDKVSIKAVSSDLTGPLRDSKKTRAWENMTLERLASQIAQDNNLELYYSGPEHRFERQDQRNEGDIAFLNRLCGERSMYCKVHQGKIILFDCDEAESGEPVFTVYKTGDMYSPKSYSFKVSSANTDYTDAEVAYCDPKTGTTHKAKVKSNKKSRDVSGTEKTMTVQKRVENPEQAVALGKSELHAANAKEQTSSLEIMGCPRIAAGQMLKLEDFGEFSGDYFIASATHKVSGSGLYSTSCELTTPAPTEAESAHEEKSEAAEAAKEEVAQADLDRRSGVVLYPPGQYPFPEAALIRLEEVREKVNEFLIQAQSGTEEERIQAERDWMIINCLHQIAKAQVLNKEKPDKDDKGWLYLSDMLQFWPSGYKNNDADQNERAFFVEWKWLYEFQRVKEAYREFIEITDKKPQTILNLKAQDFLGDILFNNVEYDNVEKNRQMKELREKILPLYCKEVPSENKIYFDFIHSNWKHWELLYYAYKSVPGFSFGTDGLAAAMSSFTLRALAKGYAQKNGAKWRIYVEQIAVFGHDKFNFEESPDWKKDELGFWDCDKMEFYIIPPVLSSSTFRRMNNGIFRGFRDRHGFGADFLVLSQLHMVENFMGADYVYPQ